MLKKALTVLAHAFVGWALCDATMMLGMAATTLENALVIHAVAAPVIFTLISFVYFNNFHDTTPLQTALIFTGFVIAVDFFIVALLINKSLEMFTSILGTWLPFALIFSSTYLTGWVLDKRYRHFKVVNGEKASSI